VPLTAGATAIDGEGMVEDKLACLGKAVCGPTTERVLPEGFAALAYDA
jgi:hypothetical protein